MEFKRLVYEAARAGRLHELKRLLDNKSREDVFSVVSARTYRSTPLVMACTDGHLDVALYLVEICNADIEQVGSSIFDYGIRTVAPPLWYAAASGHLNIVEMLVKHNASVNCTTEDNITPLSYACSYDHLEIAKYLIQHGADIEIADRSGCSCLMSACLQGHFEISKHLLECGADMNRKSVSGNTALHYCAMSGSLDILEMLLKCGAKSVCDSYGTTPLLTAAVEGHSQVVEYIIHEFDCTKQEKVNALELLGSVFMMNKFDTAKAFDCWKRAMELRYEDEESPFEKSVTRSFIATCIDATEVRNLHQLEELNFDPDEMWIQALLVLERVLGTDHRYRFPYILSSGLRYSISGNFQRCMKLWMHELDMQIKFQNTLNPYTLELLSCLAELFSSMMKVDSAFERNVQQVSFQDILHVFDISVKKIENDLYALTTEKNDNYTSQFRSTLITAIHLIGLMCRLQPYLNMHETTELKKAVHELVRLNPKGKNDSTLLHLACCRVSSCLDNRFSIIKFPSFEVVDLLLEVGACPNAVDGDKNTPLHVAAMSMPCSPAIFKALANHGAHLDLCNRKRKTPLQLAEIATFFDDYPMRYINLKCLCSQAIRKHAIAYKGFVPKKLKEFLDSH